MTVKQGDVLADKYRIEKLLGEGGMGAVWIATNNVLQKQVALKVMSERFAKIPAAAERFQREAIAASKVSHTSICQVFDAGQHDGRPWIAMELLEGESLADRLIRGPMPLDEVLHMSVGVLSALAEVHENGIVHRDLKPDNIFLCRDRRGGFTPKVLDFGVAKDTRGEQLSKLTATGAVVGTAYYLSPEQAKGLPDIDARADVYAMGVVLFECLSGQMPYEADTITQLIAKMFTEEPQILSQVAPEVPPAIVDVVTTCLHQDRERRFQTARGLLGALESAAQVGPGPARAFAPTGVAISAGGTAQGAPFAPRPPSGGGVHTPAPSHTAMGHGHSVQAHGSSPGSQPGVYGSSPGHGSAPGYPMPHTSDGAYPSQGRRTPPTMVVPPSNPPPPMPGMHAAAGSSPGLSHPGHAQAGMAHPGPSHAGSQPGYAQMPAQSMPAQSMPAQSMPAQAAPRSSSRLALFALVVVLFLVGAAGTGGLVFFLNVEDDVPTSGAIASSGGAPSMPDPPPIANDSTSGDTTATAIGPADPNPMQPVLAPGTEPDPAPSAVEDPPNDDDGADDDGADDDGAEERGGSRGRRRHHDPGSSDPSAPVADDPDPTPAHTEPDPAPHEEPTPRPDPPHEEPNPTPPRRSGPPGLTQAQINTVVQARLQYLAERCYQRVLRREPNVAGIVTVAWTVEPNGRVGDHRVVHNSTNNDYLARCTDNIVRDLRFPAASNGNATPARYPFSFQNRH
ncbi:MAG: protein kinase [Sandaracinaceae bacterium]